jgi:uncharacterized protein (TIGR02246 family)
MIQIDGGESNRTLPQAPTLFQPYGPEDRDAILTVFATLERAVNMSDGDLFDSVIGEDVVWGSPKGQLVLGLDLLNSVHRRLAANSRQYGSSSRFILEALRFVRADIACATVRRTGLDEHGRPLIPSQSSIVQELVLYVLVKRVDRWWIAAAQNTPVIVA